MAVQVQKEALEEKRVRTAAAVENKFRDESELTEEQLTNPDYALEQIFGPDRPAVCSRCHHCR